MHNASTNTATRENGTVAILPMIPSCRDIYGWRPIKFTHHQKHALQTFTSFMNSEFTQ
jgi:hypothetical protein